MPVRRLLFVVAAALLCSGSALAANPAASLPAGWSHAQVNVVGPRGVGHTWIYDRGRVQSVGSSSLTLSEPDTTVTIQVAPDAVVKINGRFATLSAVRVGDKARTLGVDGKPAKQVLVTRPVKVHTPRLR
jgi:hypothetical protein